jgi:hypothetical protein
MLAIRSILVRTWNVSPTAGQRSSTCKGLCLSSECIKTQTGMSVWQILGGQHSFSNDCVKISPTWVMTSRAAFITDRHKRLAQLQQSSKRNPHYQTLERDLIELQEQQLFELFVVVSLQKKPSGTSYIPQVIQQFPSKVGARRPRSIWASFCVLCRFADLCPVFLLVISPSLYQYYIWCSRW